MTVIFVCLPPSPMLSFPEPRLISKFMENIMTELVDIFDEDWEPTGEILEKDEAERLGKWRRIVHIWIVNSHGELLLQRRAPNKKLAPNMWDISVAGHVRAGETVIQAGAREAREELGIDIDTAQLIEYNRDKWRKKQHLRTEFVIKLDLPVNTFTFNDQEVAEVKYVPWRELAKMSEDDMVANNIIPHKGYRPLFEYLKKNGFR